MRSTVQLTKGSLLGGVLVFAGPLLVSALLQQLYGVTDLWFAGNAASVSNTAALGAGSVLLAALTQFAVGFSSGVSVVSSNIEGEDVDCISRGVISAGIIYSLIVGGVLMLIGELLASPLISITHVPDAISRDTLAYMRWFLIGTISTMLYNVLSAIIRAKGNSAVPMWILLFGVIFNFLADALFVSVLHLGVSGLAIATVICQTATALVSFLYLLRISDPDQIRSKPLPHDYMRIAAIGIPAGLQSLAISLSNVFVQNSINAFGVDAISGFAIYQKVEMVIYVPILAIGQAALITAGQNFGAGLYDRVKRTSRVSIMIGVIYTAISAAILVIFSAPIAGFFDGGAGAIAAASLMISTTFPFYFLYVFLEVWADVLRGCGRSAAPAIIIIAGMCGFRTLSLILLDNLVHTVHAVMLVFPLTWGFVAALLGICYLYHARRG